MLDDDTAGFIELLNAFQRSIGIGDIVERQCFAGELHRGRNTGFLEPGLCIKCGILVWIFTVAHALHMVILESDGPGKQLVLLGLDHASEIIGDSPVITGGMLESLDRQREAGCLGQ